MMKALVALGLLVPLFMTRAASAGDPVAEQYCIDLDQNCASTGTTLATKCGSGSYKLPRKVSEATFGPGVTSATLVQCRTAATMVVTANTDFCMDLPGGWNDEVCEIDIVATATCPPTPTSGCVTSAHASLSIKDAATNTKDKLVWKWFDGPMLTQSAFGDPTSSTSYDVCIYSNSAPAASMHVASGHLWVAKGTIGYKYKDSSSSNSGINAITLDGGGDASKISLKGVGIPLPAAATASTFFDMSTPLTVQLVASGMCLESSFNSNSVTKNSVGAFKATF